MLHFQELIHGPAIAYPKGNTSLSSTTHFLIPILSINMIPLLILLYLHIINCKLLLLLLNAGLDNNIRHSDSGLTHLHDVINVTVG